MPRKRSTADASAFVIIADAAQRLIDEHGGRNAAAAAVGIDPSLLTKLRDGRVWASPDTLQRLGLTLCPIDAAVQPKVGQRTQKTADELQGATLESLRQGLPPSARERFDRAVNRAIAIHEAELQKSYAEHVRAEAARIMPDQFQRELKQAKKEADFSHRMHGIYRHRAALCEQAMNMVCDSYRVITAALHPDRAPEDRRAQFTKAMEAINLIKQAADKAKKDL